MADKLIQVVWEFRVKPGCEEEFEARYANNGSWAHLFRKSAGYLGTVLLRDQGQPRHYLLTDLWRDLASLEAFRREFAREYEALDRSCEALTEEERLLGYFPPTGEAL